MYRVWKVNQTIQMNKPKEYMRIDRDIYNLIEKKARVMGLSSNTTELEVAYILGQQSILKIIRDDILVENASVQSNPYR